MSSISDGMQIRYTTTHLSSILLDHLLPLRRLWHSSIVVQTSIVWIMISASSWEYCKIVLYSPKRKYMSSRHSSQSEQMWTIAHQADYLSRNWPRVQVLISLVSNIEYVKYKKLPTGSFFILEEENYFYSSSTTYYEDQQERYRFLPIHQIASPLLVQDYLSRSWFTRQYLLAGYGYRV